MSINNLHSLLNRPWYIDMAYAESHLPLLVNMLEGKSQISDNQKQEPAIASLINMAGSPMELNENLDQKVVAVLDFKSPIFKYDQSCGPQGTQSKKATLERLKNNDQVAAIVLDMDSGGGQAYGTPEFYDYLQAYPKPIVTYTGGMMCSAAYYIGSAADHIVANKRAEAIGSIGAYTQLLDTSGLMEKQGVKIHTIYAERSTEKNKAYRDALSGNYESYITQELNPLVEDFIADIKAVRPSINDKVFKGATYKGPKALSMGLVDSLGTLEDAISIAFNLSKETSNPNNNQMIKANSYPNLEAVLEVSEPLATTDNGSFLQEEQKKAVEDKLSALTTSLQEATDAKATAEALLATEKETNTALTAGLKSAATLAGVEAIADDASAVDIQAALTAKIEELNWKPGAAHTTGAAPDPATKKEFDYIDFESSIYKNK